MKRCCGPLLAGRPADTPLDLMRSRYAAYATGDVDYVMRTTDPSGPQWMADTGAWREQVTAFCEQHRFVDLRIVNAPPADDDTGHVHFQAHLERDGSAQVLEERSRFRRIGGRWLYHGPVTD